MKSQSQRSLLQKLRFNGRPVLAVADYVVYTAGSGTFDLEHLNEAKPVEQRTTKTP